ncbi:MAG: uracil-xanthine permease family protein [Christensenellales bacterium]|jgi:uracil permease|nr:uracil-xanthine permease [Clostridiales bacterium]
MKIKKDIFKNFKYKSQVKNGILAFQHMFAMLGATIVVPIISNMSISMALIGAGIGTIIFYFVTQKKVPVFLGSSFAFLPALIAIVGPTEMYSPEWQAAMSTAVVGILVAGLIYVILSFLIKFIGVQKIRKLFPAEVVGPVIILIGMILVPKMFYNNIIIPGYGEAAWKHWTTAIITALTIVVVNAFAPKNSFLKVIPILFGFIVGYIYAAAIGLVSYKGVFSKNNIIIFQNIGKELSFYKGFGLAKGSQYASAILMIAPMAIVTFMEHLGDISANSIICEKDFMVDPGLNRTLLGDGLATMASGLIGGPPNTTYGENTAVLAITKNYNPKNLFYAACLAVVFGVFSVFGAFLSTIPAAVIGGASIVLFGMISASGLRAMVEARVDFNNSRNMIIVSIILSLGLGLNSMSIVGDALSQYSDNHNLAKMFKMQIGDVEISPLAIATLVGIILNLVMPNKEEEKAQYTYINLQSDENETKDPENASILEDCSVESSKSSDLEEVTTSSEDEA